MHHTIDTLKNTPDAVKATFYDVIVMGEAMRDLVAKRDSSVVCPVESGPRIELGLDLLKRLGMVVRKLC